MQTAPETHGVAAVKAMTPPVARSPVSANVSKEWLSLTLKLTRRVAGTCRRTFASRRPFRAPCSAIVRCNCRDRASCPSSACRARSIDQTLTLSVASITGHFLHARLAAQAWQIGQPLGSSRRRRARYCLCNADHTVLQPRLERQCCCCQPACSQHWRGAEASFVVRASSGG